MSTAKDAEHYKRINDFLATSIHSNPGNYSDDDVDEYDMYDDDHDIMMMMITMMSCDNNCDAYCEMYADDNVC